MGINDKVLEKNNIMLPVISMNLRYLKPAHYDELLTIKTYIKNRPVTRFSFEFEIVNEKQEKICRADSTVVFVDSKTRKPMRAPEMIEKNLLHKFKAIPE